MWELWNHKWAMFANDITLGATKISKVVPSSARLPRLLCFHSPAQAQPGEDPDHLVFKAHGHAFKLWNSHKTFNSI